LDDQLKEQLFLDHLLYAYQYHDPIPHKQSHHERKHNPLYHSDRLDNVHDH